MHLASGDHASALDARTFLARVLFDLGKLAESESTMREAGRVMRGQRPGGGAPGSR